MLKIEKTIPQKNGLEASGITGAEFKTLREACGLSVPDMARLAVSPKTGQPVGERTVRYWESCAFDVPADVANLLRHLDASLTESARQAVEVVSKGMKGDEVEVFLVRYRENEDLWVFRKDMKGLPATCHAALINRVRLALEAIGCRVVIVWMEPGEYSLWLKENKYEDDEARRAQWAGEQK